MEKFRKNICKMRRCFIGDKSVGNTKKLQITEKCSGSGSTDIIGYQKSCAMKGIAKSSCLTSGSSTKASKDFAAFTGK